MKGNQLILEGQRWRLDRHKDEEEKKKKGKQWQLKREGVMHAMINIVYT